MKIKFVVLAVVCGLLAGLSAAKAAHHEGEAPATEGLLEAGMAVEAGNTICPVSGEKVGQMGPAFKVEYNGKIYSLCCAMCKDTFLQDPEKYIKKVEADMGQPAHDGHEHSH